MHKKDFSNIFQKIYFKLFDSYLSDKAHGKFILNRWLRSSNIDAPKTFNEKIQWIKLNDRNDLYTKLVDKYSVREYVEGKIGSDYLTKLIGVWDSSDDIDFNKLPDSFVLKTTQASGTNIIVHDKSRINKSEVRNKLYEWLKINYYKIGREWAYKDVQPKIICEELLQDESNAIPTDFKFFCFNGNPKFVQLDLDRFGNHERVFYDMDWKKQDFTLLYPLSYKEIDKPEKFEIMVRLASILSENIPFCRVDLYTLPRVVFGEMTFYPGNGTEQFFPERYDLELGNLINLEIDD